MKARQIARTVDVGSFSVKVQLKHPDNFEILRQNCDVKLTFTGENPEILFLTQFFCHEDQNTRTETVFPLCHSYLVC